MRCMNCGNEIADGYAVCPICGSSTSGQYNMQPQTNVTVVNYVPKPRQYFYPGGPFTARVKTDFTIILSLVGTFFLFLFTLIPAWFSFGMGAQGINVGKSLGLFSSLSNEGQLRELTGLLEEAGYKLMPGIINFAAVILILLSLWMLFKYMVIFNIIPNINLSAITRIPGSEFVAPVVYLFLFIIITTNKSVHLLFAAVDFVKREYADEIGKMGVQVNIYCHHSVSWWFALIGIICLFVRPIMCMIKRIDFYTGEKIIRVPASQAPMTPAYPMQQTAPIAQNFTTQPYSQPQQFAMQPQQFGQQPQQFGAVQGQQNNNQFPNS